MSTMTGHHRPDPSPFPAGEEVALTPTAHARARCQQRGVPELVIDMIVSFGAEVRSRGASKYFLDRKGRARLERVVGHEVVRRHERKLNSYVVISDDGMLITAAPRLHRVKH